MHRWPTLTLTLIVLYAAAACAPAPSVTQSRETAASPANTQPKRLVVAIMAEPPALHRALIPPGFVIQTGDVPDTIVNVGLSVTDNQSVRRPVLAETVPSLDNGLWELLPDGRMRLTWKIRPGAMWHDGTPFTADDLRFSAQIAQDPEFPEFRAQGLALLSGVEVVDGQTIATLWKQPYIRADRLFGTGSDTTVPPLPRHLLEDAAQTNKEGFRQLPYWTTAYVGVGPYKLQEWVAGSHFVLAANDNFVLGRPRIDQLEIRFILDADTLVANILAGTVEATIGTGLNLEQALNASNQWREGRLNVAVDSWVFAAPQFINPDPTIVTDVRFRRALLQAVDRQTLAEAIQAGLVPPASSPVRPNEAEYKEIVGAIRPYDYDPASALRQLQDLGYTRGQDGVLQNTSGRLSLEVRATASPAIHAKTMLPVADAWQRLGVDIQEVIIPVQRLTDLEYRTTHPAFEVVRYRSGAGNIEQLHGGQAPLPQNRFAGTNRSRYVNPEFDGLLDQYLATIPWAPRMQALSQVVGHITDQLNVMGLIYDVQPALIGNRLLNVTDLNLTWSINQWELTAK